MVEFAAIDRLKLDSLSIFKVTVAVLETLLGVFVTLYMTVTVFPASAVVGVYVSLPVRLSKLTVPTAVPPDWVMVVLVPAKKSSFTKISTSVACPTFAVAVSSFAVGKLTFGSVLFGFPSLSISGSVASGIWSPSVSFCTTIVTIPFEQFVGSTFSQILYYKK